MPPSRKQSAPTFDEIKRFRSADDIDLAIRKLSRRIPEVEALKAVRYDDQARYSAESAISKTVLEVFGPNSPEYGEHQYHHIWRGGHFINMPAHESQASFLAGIPQTVEMLNGLIRGLEEKKADLSHDAPARARSAFEFMDLHPRIAGCADLYRDGHYRQAVFEASVALVNYVKERSGEHGLDGVPLMTKVFSKNSPVLRFNDLADQTDRDEQEGLMHLFMGAVLALRNPRAHATFEDPPEVALDCIAFLSMLARRLDTAKRV